MVKNSVAVEPEAMDQEGESQASPTLERAVEADPLTLPTGGSALPSDPGTEPREETNNPGTEPGSVLNPGTEQPTPHITTPTDTPRAVTPAAETQTSKSQTNGSVDPPPTV